MKMIKWHWKSWLSCLLGPVTSDPWEEHLFKRNVLEERVIPPVIPLHVYGVSTLSIEDANDVRAFEKMVRVQSRLENIDHN